MVATILYQTSFFDVIEKMSLHNYAVHRNNVTDSEKYSTDNP